MSLLQWIARIGLRRQLAPGRKMRSFLQNEASPLRLETSGAIRVGKTRVLLEIVFRAFLHGATPESIAESERKGEVKKRKWDIQNEDLSALRARLETQRRLRESRKEK
jgi:hypothetical protein